MRDLFRRFAQRSSLAVGSPAAFLLAAAFCVVWAVSGPVFHWSDAWQLVANTVTNIVTFLMVFLIQYSQNRDTAAMQLKLDETLRAIRGARNSLIALEDLPDEELDRLEAEMRAIRAGARSRSDVAPARTEERGPRRP